jgi:hypothetical protein
VSRDDNAGLGGRTAAGGPGTAAFAVLDAPDDAWGAVVRLASDDMLVRLRVAPRAHLCHTRVAV